jgi:hypothetical protein
VNLPEDEDPIYLSSSLALETFIGGETSFGDLEYQGQDVGDQNGQELLLMVKVQPDADHQCTPY